MNDIERLIEDIKSIQFNDISYNSSTTRMLYKFIEQIETYKNLINDKSLTHTIVPIENISQLSPVILEENNSNDFLSLEIKEFIKEHTDYILTYNFITFNIKIRVKFYIYDCNDVSNINKYIKYVIIWLIICSTQAVNKCGSKREMNIDIYLTPYEKQLPNSPMLVLDKNNVNSAFTYRCGGYLGITIYRKEEWFKVFIHESIHYFGFDTLLSNRDLNNKISKLFNINSTIDIHESYCEFWARLINIIFISIINYNKKKLNNQDKINIEKNILENLYIERKYALFQAVKVLAYMNIDYKDLLNNKIEHEYNENTHVFGYYILTAILLYDWPIFLEWLNKHNNVDILRFHNRANIDKLYKYIEIHSNNIDMINNIDNVKKLFKILYDNKNNMGLNTMRMSILEI